jgi:hypothetical protein
VRGCFPLSPLTPLCSSREHLLQFPLRHPVFRHLLPINQQDGNFETVAIEQFAIARDVDLFERNRMVVRLGNDVMDERFHLVAQMSAGLAVDCQAHDRAIASAAPRGSAAATMGRPTTR